MTGWWGRLRAVAHNTYLESVRQRLFFGVVFFALLLMLAALVLKDISVHQDKKIIADIGLGAIDFFGTIIAIFIGVDLVGRDVERRTLHLLLVKPLRREEFIVGRYLGLCLTLLTSMVLMCLGLTLALWTVGGSFSWSLLGAATARTSAASIGSHPTASAPRTIRSTSSVVTPAFLAMCTCSLHSYAA